MKVLLMGEFSSLHKFLKEGLQELGVDVTLAANGDGWKNIPGADCRLHGISSQNKVDRIYHRLLEPYAVAGQFKDYDVVQLINTKIYSHRINANLIAKIKRKNKCLSLLATGMDYRLYEAYLEGKFKHYIFDYIVPKEYDLSTKYARKWKKNDLIVENLSDVIIPTMYDYSVGYRKNPKTAKPIPLPVNVKDIEYSPNVTKSKIVFFHGISRPIVKGTPFIKEALLKLQESYPNDVQVVMTERLPYEEYVKVIKQSNVLIDQCCSAAYGINACISMAQGKVVLSSNTELNRNALEVDGCPIVEIEPNTNQIYGQLCHVLERKNELERMGYESRVYVENVHDHVKIAKRYLDAWNMALHGR